MSNIDRTIEQAVAYHRAGRLGEAESMYRSVLVQQPANADALHLLGVLFSQTGCNDLGIPLIIRAVGINPGNADFHRNLGRAQLHAGQPKDATDSIRNAIKLMPEIGESWNLLGLALQASGDLAEAEHALRRATQLGSTDIGGLNNLANHYRSQQKLDSAIVLYKEAHRIQPQSAGVLENLGSALRMANRFSESVQVLRGLIASQPRSASARCQLGHALREAGCLHDAIRCFREAIALDPNRISSHTGLALSLLAAGDFLEGFREFEWRWHEPALAAVRPTLGIPAWDGSQSAGQRILLHAEQGFGDTIQFSRFANEVKNLGNSVTLVVPPELHRLLGCLSGIEVLARGAQLPPADFHCPLISVALALKTNVQTVPTDVPYLDAPPASVERWHDRLGLLPPCRASVGLAWSGSLTQIENSRRSISLDALYRTLSAISGIRFFSLQKGEASRQARQFPEIVDWTSEFHDFAETAAFLTCLDLVVTVDTAVAHLAGALGKRVFLMTSAVPDWRWLRDREDSPWYPTMRLFRQEEVANWDTALERLAKAVQNFMPTPAPD